jgi:hypothetical protein
VRSQIATLLLWFLAAAVPCAAQDRPAGKPAAGTAMHDSPAPATGSMPGRQAPKPKGRLGTEPVRKDKLGTAAPANAKDRPPQLRNDGTVVGKPAAPE